MNEYVKIRTSKRAKRVALRLDSKERIIELVVPARMSLKRAQDFARQNEIWIQETLATLPPALPYEDGRIIPVLGKERQLDIYIDPERKTTSITMNESYINIKTNKNEPKARIERYLKTLAKEELTKLSQDKAEIIHKSIASVTIRDTKSRWGSCSQDGCLSYSWRLIFAPLCAFDYVVAHEVAHLVHLNHSKAFWTLCRDLSLDFVEGQYWMRNHGHELMRYGARG